MAGFVVVLVAVLFPPWVYVYNFPGASYYRAPAERSERPAGYHWLFGQHIPTDQTYLTWIFNLETDHGGPERNRLGFFALRIDSTRLGFEIGTAVLLIGILYLALRSPKKDT